MGTRPAAVRRDSYSSGKVRGAETRPWRVEPCRQQTGSRQPDEESSQRTRREADRRSRGQGRRARSYTAFRALREGRARQKPKSSVQVWTELWGDAEL